MDNKKHIISGSVKRKQPVKDAMVAGSGLIRPSSVKSRSNIQNAENKTTLMILIIGVMALIGRLPIFLKYLPLTWDIKQCIGFTSETLYFFVLSLNFFVFYKFNSTFKTVFKSLFLVNLFFSKPKASPDALLLPNLTEMTLRSPCCRLKNNNFNKLEK